MLSVYFDDPKQSDFIIACGIKFITFYEDLRKKKQKPVQKYQKRSSVKRALAV